MIDKDTRGMNVGLSAGLSEQQPEGADAVAALMEIAAPIPEELYNGHRRARCRHCDSWWYLEATAHHRNPGPEAEHHGAGCAYVIARAALPHNDSFRATSAEGAKVAPGSASCAGGETP